MSDDEDITFVKKVRTVHYGSLEEQERARLSAIAAAARNDGEDGDAPPGVPSDSKELGDVHISNEYMELEDEMSKDKQALLEEFERRRKARQINVSTDDGEVRKSLRQLGEPVCLFGEGPAERRARLRDLLSFLGEDAIHKKMEEEEARIQAEKGQEGTWYHEGDAALKECRLWLAKYSLPRARMRLREARENCTTKQKARATQLQDLQRRLTAIQPIASQVGDQRPLSSCAFSSDSQMLLTSAWSGVSKVWSVPDCSLLHTLKGHVCQVSKAAFRPGVVKPSHFGANHTDIESSAKELSMASCAYDGTVKLWNFASEEPIGELSGHEPHRVSRLAFHPCGRFLGTCCRDSSWRLWDLTTGTELLYQEGHARPPHDIDFQEDGSLAATGGLDAFGRVWDLRTGRCIMFMEGHLKAVYSISWSPSGYELATGGGDNAVRVWDLRNRQCLHTLPAHNNLISTVRWQRTSGLCITTASYDCALKIWAHKSWQALRTLQGHDSKIMAMDVSYDDKYIVSAAYDRTYKLWAAE